MAFVVDVPGQGAVDFGDEATAKAYFQKNAGNMPTADKGPSLMDDIGDRLGGHFDDYETGLRSFANSYTAGIPEKSEKAAGWFAKKVLGLAGADKAVDFLNNEPARIEKLKEDNPAMNAGGAILGLFSPGGVMSKTVRAGSKVAGSVAKVGEKVGVPFITKLLKGPAVQGGVSGGVGNLLYGQAAEDVDASIRERASKAMVDLGLGTVLGGGLGKVGDMISKRIATAKSPKEVERLVGDLRERFGSIQDPTERAQAIAGHLDEFTSSQQGQVTGAGERIKKALEDEVGKASGEIKAFYKEFTRGNKTKAQVQEAKAFLQKFFQEQGFMNKAGQWVDEAGRPAAEPVARYGAGGTTNTQQQYLFDRFKDLFRNPDLDRLHGIRKAIGQEAYGGAQPLFPKGNSGIVKGLESAIRADEEAAIRAAYGDDVAGQFLAKKKAFKDVAEPIKVLGRKLGFVNEAGDFVITKSGDEIVTSLSKLGDDELQKILPILERQGVMKEFPQIEKAFENIRTAEKVGKGYQNVAKKLSDDPEFISAFEKGNANLPEEALDQFKADYLERAIQKAGGNNAKLAKELGKLPSKARSMLFSDEELRIIHELETQAAVPTKGQGFLMKLLSGKLGQALPDNVGDMVIQNAPSNLISIVDRIAKGARAGSPKVGAADSGFRKAVSR